jgi:hypothetical protein
MNGMKKLIATIIFFVTGVNHFAYAGAAELWLMKNYSDTPFYVDVAGDSDGTCKKSYGVPDHGTTYSGVIENDSWWACKLAPNKPADTIYHGTISTRDIKTEKQIESIHYQAALVYNNHGGFFNENISYTSAKGVASFLTCAGYFFYDYSTWINIIINSDKTISLVCN